MNIVHIVPESSHVVKFLELLEKYGQSFKLSDHHIIVQSQGRVDWSRFSRLSHVECIPARKAAFILPRKLKNVDKIFWHGLFNPRLFLLLSVLPSKLLRKSYWVIWGSDLYYYPTLSSRKLKAWVVERLRRVSLSRIRHYCGLVEEDLKLAQKWYNSQAVVHKVFYPNVVSFDTLDDVLINKADHELHKILVGNSATKSNKHFEVIEFLSRLSSNKNFSFQVICPLSYGDKKYAQQVVEYGRRKLKDKFIPIMDFLPPRRYAKILASVDVAIMNHDRQQALGNIFALLYLRKKVYVRSDTTTWKFLNQLGITVFDTIKLLNYEETKLFEFDEMKSQENRRIVKSELSEEQCVKMWQKVFNE